MIAPRREHLRAYVSRAELAGELSISENSVDEMVRRSVLRPGCRQLALARRARVSLVACEGGANLAILR